MSDASPSADPRLRLRLSFAGGFTMGPGKADLLEGVARTGSIAAAARDMGMSYKRAWSLIEVMNAAFAEPVVEAARGGRTGGGADLAATGAAVLRHYRAFERLSAEAARDEIGSLTALLRPRA